MSLTPTQLSELQTIVEALRVEFPSSDDVLWEAAIRLQKGGLGPVTGPGGVPAFETAVADIVLEAEQISTVQGRQGGLGNSVAQATFNVVPVEDNLPPGTVGSVIYLDVAPNTYLSTDVVELTPAGPNSVVLSEIGTQVARTVAAASGGMEVNNLSTGAGFERVLTASDLGGGVNSVTGGVNINLTGTGVDPIVNLDAAISGVSVNGVSLTTGGVATNFLDETGNYSVPAGAGGGGAVGTIKYDFDTGTVGGDPGAGNFEMSTANPISVAFFTFSDTDADALDVQNVLSTLTNGCHLLFRNTADNTQFRLYVVTSITDNVGWYQFNVSYVAGNGDATIGAAGTEIEFEFFTSGWAQPGVALGANVDEIAYWNPSSGYWEGSGTLIAINAASPPLGGRLQLGTTSGYSTTSPQILRPLGAADTVMDFVYGTDANNGFLQGYRRVAGEMSFGARIASTNTDLLTLDLSANVLIESAATFRIGEKAAAAADLATYGQLWVNSADDSLNYVTEAGVNFDLTAAGASPGGADTNVQYNAAGVFAGDASFAWDTTNRQLTFNKSGTGAVSAINVVEVPPGGVVFQMGGSLSGSTNWSIFRSFDNGGVNFWQLLDDHGLSAPNHKLEFLHSTVSPPFIEMDASGELSLGGSQNSEALQITGIGATLKLRAQDNGNGGLYFEERATAGAFVAGDGQVWVRNDAPATLMFTDDLGADVTLSIPFTATEAGLAPLSGGGTTNFLRADGTWAVPPGGVANPLTADLDGDGFNLDDFGVIFMREQATADADVTGQGQIWVLDEGFTQSLMYTNDNGNDFELAALNLTDMNTSALLVTGTAFVESLVFQPDINRDYMINSAFEVTSPAADDMKVEMVIDTNAVFKGVLTYSNQSAGITGTFALESGIGDVITNIVVVPTDGSATPDGTYVTIVGCLRMGATSGTHSVRVGKNADTGADGRFEATAALQASVLQVS